MYSKVYMMLQAEMYSNLIGCFALLSRFSLAPCLRAFNLRSSFCNFRTHDIGLKKKQPLRHTMNQSAKK